MTSPCFRDVMSSFQAHGEPPGPGPAGGNMGGGNSPRPHTYALRHVLQPGWGGMGTNRRPDRWEVSPSAGLGWAMLWSSASFSPTHFIFLCSFCCPLGKQTKGWRLLNAPLKTPRISSWVDCVRAVGDLDTRDMSFSVFFCPAG